MCEGSGVSAEIIYAQVPLMERVKELCAKFIYADNTMRNWKAYESKVNGIGSESLLTLCDPQTSGGLLISVDAGYEQDFLKIILPLHPTIYKIGSIINKHPQSVIIR
jgi:selenide,water dikinase